MTEQRLNADVMELTGPASIKQLDMAVNSFLLTAIANELPLELVESLDDIKFGGWRPTVDQCSIVGTVWFLPKAEPPVGIYVRIDDTVREKSLVALLKVIEYKMLAVAKEAERALRSQRRFPMSIPVQQTENPPVSQIASKATGPRARQIDLEVE